MLRWLAAALLGVAPAVATPVTIPGDPPLKAELSLPATPAAGPAVVGLHGCGGLVPRASLHCGPAALAHV